MTSSQALIREVNDLVLEQVFILKQRGELDDRQLLEYHLRHLRILILYRQIDRMKWEVERQSMKSVSSMRITMGIACEKCAIVYLITSTGSTHVAALPRTIGHDMFMLLCLCGDRQSFHKKDLRPYLVSAQGHTKGYVKPGEYSTHQFRDTRKMPGERSQASPAGKPAL